MSANLLQFPEPHESQRISNAEWTKYVQLLRDYQETQESLRKIKKLKKQMKADLEAWRQSILARLDRGGGIEKGGRIAK